MSNNGDPGGQPGTDDDELQWFVSINYPELFWEEGLEEILYGDASDQQEPNKSQAQQDPVDSFNLVDPGWDLSSLVLEDAQGQQAQNPHKNDADDLPDDPFRFCFGNDQSYES